jgi:hypothetical protein
MNRKKPKIGRSGGELLREQAAAIVNTYVPVLDSPDGRYCVNPTDPLEEQTWVTTPQALRFLLDDLKNFAETGSFSSGIDFKSFSIRERYRSLTDGGAIRETAIELLEAEFHCSRSTIERTIRVDKAKKQAHRERVAKATDAARQLLEARTKREKPE